MTDRMLNERLDALICEADSAKFSAFAEALTCKDFRRACVILSDYTLPSITDENVFWHAFVFLCRCNAKAFLVTCLKAVRRLYLNGKLTFHSDILAEYAAEVARNDLNIDRQKFLTFVLPFIRTGKEINYLWRIFSLDDTKTRIHYLIQSNTPAVYYCIFREAGKMVGESAYLEKLCAALIRKNDALAFNLVSIMQSYYGIASHDWKFSLTIKPYQLAYIDKSEANFRKVLTSV